MFSFILECPSRSPLFEWKCRQSTTHEIVEEEVESAAVGCKVEHDQRGRSLLGVGSDLFL